MDTQLTRREALRWASAATVGLLGSRPFRLKAKPADPAIRRIESSGPLISNCSLPGETRADDVVPAHPNGIPASRNRWLLVYATRGFRGVDDDLSIIYQLRAGTADGRVIKEGFLARTRNDWDPFNDGSKYVLQHGHPVAFGVPRGASIRGRPAINGNVFVVKWRRCARILDPAKNYLLHDSGAAGVVTMRTQDVEWVQFRLNAREDDIEIIQPAGPLRQKGFATGLQFCRVPGVKINESFVQAVPYNRDFTEWADCCFFYGAGGGKSEFKSALAAMKYAFNPELGRYEWTEMGPLLDGIRGPAIPGAGGGGGIIEPSLVRWKGGWVIAARGGPRGGTTWYRTEDLFGVPPEPVVPELPHVSAPRTAYRWQDGVLRLFSGDARNSPYRDGRDPLYCWDIDPERAFAASNRTTIFDTFAAGLPIPLAAGPKIDMCKLLPYQGPTQIIAYRVTMRSFNHPYTNPGGPGTPSLPIATPPEKAACAIYYSTVTYAESYPSAWEYNA